MSSCSMRTHTHLAQSIEQLLEPYSDTTHVAVVAVDPTTGWTYRRQPDRVFHAASTMKVPVLIALFRQASDRQFDLADSIPVSTQFRSIVDGEPFILNQTTDSDQEIYEWSGKEVAIIDLAHRMINVSSNLATNLLVEMIGAEEVQATIEALGTTNMQVLRGVEDIAAHRRGLNNTTSANDLAVLFTAMSNGEAVSLEYDRMMLSILEEQHFNEMIPAGLPENTRVAHKTGQITRIHHDAGIVFPSGSAPYVLVVLTEGFVDDALSGWIGSEIARIVHAELLTNRGR